MTRAPDINDIHDAARRLAGLAVYTPLLESTLFNEAVNGRVLIKAECLQRTGSFKFRGAYNRLSLISPRDRARGVVAYSSGNHAQGVAAAAGILGMSATIVMPATAPAIKKANTRALGADVIEYDIATQSRESIGARLVEESGATLVKPYDDPGIIAGQGTAGVEIVDELDRRGLSADQLVSPCGGGGLIAGLAIAIHDKHPGCAVYSAEPEHFDDTARSLASGRRERIKPGHRSICDAIITPEPGELTFEVNRRHLAGGVSVSDREVQNAMRTAFERFKIVVEPGGAVALAAVLSGRIKVENRCTVVVCSGGNVDASLFARCLD